MTDLFEIARVSDISVEYCRLPLSESASISDNGHDFILMDYSLIEGGPEERVHLSHELGHCMTGSFYNFYANCDVRRKHENHADKWAIKKIIPKDDLDRAVSQGHCDIHELSAYFNVTEGFMRKAICLYTYGNLAVECYCV